MKKVIVSIYHYGTIISANEYVYYVETYQVNLLELRDERSAAGARQDAVHNRGDVRDGGPVRRRPRCVNDADQIPNVSVLVRGLPGRELQKYERVALTEQGSPRPTNSTFRERTCAGRSMYR